MSKKKKCLRCIVEREVGRGLFTPLELYNSIYTTSYYKRGYKKEDEKKKREQKMIPIK